MSDIAKFSGEELSKDVDKLRNKILGGLSQVVNEFQFDKINLDIGFEKRNVVVNTYGDKVKKYVPVLRGVTLGYKENSEEE